MGVGGSPWLKQECDAGMIVLLQCFSHVLLYCNVPIFSFCVCARQVRDGRTGSVLFQSEEKASRIRCTCLCRQPSVVVLGQEDGTVQVRIIIIIFHFMIQLLIVWLVK